MNFGGNPFKIKAFAIGMSIETLKVCQKPSL
jgi:hypothetical protein